MLQFSNLSKKAVNAIIWTIFVAMKLGLSQQIDWVVYDTVNYSFNPTISNISAAVGPDKSITTPFLSNYVLSYNQFLFGSHTLKTIDTTGTIFQTNAIGPKATIKSLRYTPEGKLIVSGAFMDTLKYNGIAILGVNDPGQFVMNAFLMSIDENGALHWSRNITQSYPAVEMIDADAIAPNGKYWFANMGFGNLNSAAICVGNEGQDSIIIPLPNASSLLADIEFDASGALYLSGGIGSGSFDFGGLPVSIATNYNRFLAKMNAGGAGSWFRTINDITIQKHEISLDGNANIYFSGALDDSLTMGGYFMNGPDWVSDFLTAKFDSSGTILWAHDMPQGITITGDARLSLTQSIMADNAGFYQFVSYRGLIDFGNGNSVGAYPAAENYGVSVMRFDTEGQLLWSLDIPTTYGLYPYSLVNSTNGSGYIVGTASGSQQIGNDSILVPSNFSYYTWVARFSNSLATGSALFESHKLPFVFPNPSTDGNINTALLSNNEALAIFDLQGRLRLNVAVNTTSGILETGLPTGLYLIRSNSGKTQRWSIVR
jgi:hypothetical protein